MPELNSSTDTDPAAETPAERRIRLLQELSGIGMELARGLLRQAPAAPAEVEDADPQALKAAADAGTAYVGLSRAVRLTLVLEDRFEQDLKASAPRPAPPPAPPPRPQPGPRRLDTSERWQARRRKEEVRVRMEQLIEPDTHFRESDKLRDDLEEWLDDGADEEDYADLPTNELVARICRDLGITPDWSLLQPTDWALDNPLPEVPPPERLPLATLPEPPDSGAPWPPPEPEATQPVLEMAGGWQPP